jgi:hypothetical protein
MRGAPYSGFSMLIRRIKLAGPDQSGVALPVGAISNASSGETRHDASARASQDGQS